MLDGVTVSRFTASCLRVSRVLHLSRPSLLVVVQSSQLKLRGQAAPLASLT